MSAPRHRTGFHRAYLVAIWAKGLAALLETIVGALVPFVSLQKLHEGIVLLTAPELAENPDARIAGYLSRSSEQFSSDSQGFVAIYLVAHGIIKLVMVGGLLTRRMWTYPVALFLTAAFLAYQLHRFTHTHSVWLLVAMAIDLGIAYLILREWRVRKLGYFEAHAHSRPS